MFWERAIGAQRSCCNGLGRNGTVAGLRSGLLLMLASGAALAACSEQDITRLGEATAVQSERPNIFGELGDPLPTASREQLSSFERGREVLKRPFTPATGLGPIFNVVACGDCHERPVPGGSAGRYRNFLLQGQALPDGSFTPTGVKGIQNQYSLELGRVPDAPDTNRRALRNPIPFFGVGLIAEIDEDEIARHADPDDADGDGISGRPNYDLGYIGRFGRKSQTVSIENFIRGPLFNHLGITSDPLPEVRKAALPVPSSADSAPLRDRSNLASAATEEPASDFGVVHQAQAAAPAEPTLDNDAAPDPELSEQDLFDLVSFSMLLAAPTPEPLTETSARGQQLFSEARCDACHIPALRSARGEIPLYSDLLLHDMGPERADGIPMGRASGSEFRTQPLWGVVAVGPYLHDGAADTLDEAIRLHGGEGQAARQAYLALTGADQAAVVEFLASLGGRSQATPGLLPPGDPVPAPGEYGAPREELAGAALERFRRGRAIFDRDVPVSGGLGPEFNGDSCRACHFDPVLGGAGTSGVSVTRQAIIDLQGGYHEPVNGTMAHHQSLLPERPPLDPSVNHFELRQTPPLFGLGLIDEIPAETILALADPDDHDGDGIRGRASLLPDGRLGRFGWKANVPSVSEFARDGLTNELGLTVPDQQDHTFGEAMDSDDVADPEVSLAELEDLSYFMSELGPPPRGEIDVRGQQLFAAVGCDRCHVPELETRDGVPVRLYSDLLLHEIWPEGYQGVEAGAASMRAFRTAPLWGLSETAPYLHDGSAFDLRSAILAHDGEAAAARAGFSALTESDQEEFLRFLGSL